MSFRTTVRNQPSQTLSPRPSWPTRFIPSFQSPEPISGRPCAPYFSARSIARSACSKSEADWARHRRVLVRIGLTRLERRRLEERHLLVEDRLVAGPRHVGRDARTAARADRRSSASGSRGRWAGATSAARRPRRTAATAAAQQVPAAEVRPRVEQRQHVLELIAEPERAAGLVRAAARPDPTAQRLVEQPAVHDAGRTSRRACSPGWHRACRPRSARPARARPRLASSEP